MTPTQIDRYSDTEMLLAWDSGERFTIPFVEVRFHCPCAACVDEHTGRRTLQRASIPPGIRPQAVQIVGRYALQITWNDGHATGMYPFDHLHEVCLGSGKKP
jgi:DUF971 family protein